MYHYIREQSFLQVFRSFQSNFFNCQGNIIKAFDDALLQMKKSDQFASPTSPASFLKKQSHIITNNGPNQQFFIMTPNTKNELQQSKEMHRSHFQSEANSTKFMDEEYFDQTDHLDLYSQGKQKVNEEDKNHKLGKIERQQFESFYQSDQMSSEHQNSQTKSHKKFGLSANTLSEKIIKRVASNREDKFLFINSKKQKYNNNFLFLSDADALKEEIKKYEISIDKLKDQNLKLRSEKIKISSNNQSMQLIEYRLELQSIKKKIRQLQTQKQMHLTINMQKEKDDKPHSSNSTQHHMAASCLETPSKNTDRQDPSKRNIPTFRITQDKQSDLVQQVGAKNINSPRNRPMKGENPTQNYKILQNMKSPYFLKKN